MEYALFSIQLRIRTKDETHNNENKFDGVYIINQNDPSDLQHSTTQHSTTQHIKQHVIMNAQNASSSFTLRSILKCITSNALHCIGLREKDSNNNDNDDGGDKIQNTKIRFRMK